MAFCCVERANDSIGTLSEPRRYVRHLDASGLAFSGQSRPETSHQAVDGRFGEQDLIFLMEPDDGSW